MIVTLTANPSLDRTVALAGPLERGHVQRALSVTREPGGKGVNVARVLLAAGRSAVSVLPGSPHDPMLVALRDAGIPHHAVPMPGQVRVNLTLSEPDGTTTKVNDPGPDLPDDVLSCLGDLLVERAADARWVVLSGSLPPGTPTSWYAELVERLRSTGARVAVDTSGAPLLATLDPGVTHLPELVKPNAEELAELAGDPGCDLEHDLEAATAAANALITRGVGAVLATLGAAGALLVTAHGAWHAAPPRIRPRSTVGAGDSALAGYLLAELTGAVPAERLRSAVAHGAAAVSLPGSALPTPADLRLSDVTVRSLRPSFEQDPT